MTAPKTLKLKKTNEIETKKAPEVIYELFGSKLKDARQKSVIVFVSSDKDEEAMFKYLKEMNMPWLALPYGDKHKKSLSSEFNVKGIPKLIILSSSGKLITENGRGDVNGGDTSAFDKWNQSK